MTYNIPDDLQEGFEKMFREPTEDEKYQRRLLDAGRFGDTHPPIKFRSWDINARKYVPFEPIHLNNEKSYLLEQLVTFDILQQEVYENDWLYVVARQMPDHRPWITHMFRSWRGWRIMGNWEDYDMCDCIILGGFGNMLEGMNGLMFEPGTGEHKIVNQEIAAIFKEHFTKGESGILGERINERLKNDKEIRK